jgi:hypothetical protein
MTLDINLRVFLKVNSAWTGTISDITRDDDNKKLFKIIWDKNRSIPNKSVFKAREIGELYTLKSLSIGERNRLVEERNEIVERNRSFQLRKEIVVDENDRSIADERKKVDESLVFTSDDLQRGTHKKKSTTMKGSVSSSITADLVSRTSQITDPSLLKNIDEKTESQNV